MVDALSRVIPTKVYDILVDLLPMIVLFIIVTGSSQVISAIYSKDSKFKFYKEVKSIIYIIYCFALFKLVTTTDFESYSNNFIPFKEIMRYKLFSPLFIRNNIGNVLLFLPLGYIVTDMIREKAGKVNVFITLIISLITSATIEFIQMFIGRSFDIDDIILNFIGALLGYISFFIIHYIFKKVPNKFVNDITKTLVLLLGVSVFILAFFIIYGVIK